MNLLAASCRLDSFSAQDLAHEVVPAAGLGQVSQAVDAGRSQGADRPAQPQTGTVDERLQGCLVRPVMTGRPQGMLLVKGQSSRITSWTEQDESKTNRSMRARQDPAVASATVLCSGPDHPGSPGIHLPEPERLFFLYCAWALPHGPYATYHVPSLRAYE